MASVIFDLGGIYRKSIGNVVYYSLHNKNYVRKKSLSDEKRNASPKQKRQQERFKIINILGSVMLKALRVGFPHRKPMHSPMNLFVHFNTGVWQEVGDEVAVDYTKLIVAKGTLIPPRVRGKLEVETRTLRFWTEGMRAQVGAEEDDEVYGVIVDARNGFCRYRQIGRRGEGGETALEFSDLWDMTELKVYVFALRADGREASDSLFVEVNG